MPMYTSPTPVPIFQVCPLPAPYTLFGPEISGHGVSGSSASPEDGEDRDDDDVNEEVNVQAL